MKTKKTQIKKSVEESKTNKTKSRVKSSDAYGDKMTICANTGCALRKKAKCSGFEGCPGFQAR
jgi:hypothetical protein